MFQAFGQEALVHYRDEIRLLEGYDRTRRNGDLHWRTCRRRRAGFNAHKADDSVAAAGHLAYPRPVGLIEDLPYRQSRKALESRYEGRHS